MQKQVRKAEQFVVYVVMYAKVRESALAVKIRRFEVGGRDGMS